MACQDPWHDHRRPQFRDRPSRFLGAVTVGRWQVKRIVLAVTDHGPRPQVVEAADAVVEAILNTATPSTPPPPSVTVDGVPAWVAFTIVHDARPACFLQINQWRAGVDLVQDYLTAPLDHPDRWTPVTGGAIGCVWELPIVAHERDAWVRHVLSPPDGPHLNAYLDDGAPEGNGHSPTTNWTGEATTGCVPVATTGP